MGFEEPRVLSDNVHDIRSDDGLVILTPFDFAQTEQVLDDRHQKPLLRLLIYTQSV